MRVLEVTTIVPSPDQGVVPDLTTKAALVAVQVQVPVPTLVQVQGQIEVAIRGVAQITVVKRRAKRKERRRRRKKVNMCRQKCPSSSSFNLP